MAQNSSNRPDLDENIKVAEAHARLGDEAVAVGREKSLRENGMEPVGLWMLMPCALILLLGGAVLGKGGSLFGYDELVKNGYMRSSAPGGEEVILPPGPALTIFSKEGAKIYGKCIGCHGADGAGGNGIPPLAGSEWVTGSTDQLSQIIIHGLAGPITVKGTPYNGNMPAMGDGLGPKELAYIMTYIRNEWGNSAPLVTPEMGAAALEIAKERGNSQVTVDELTKNHDKDLPGEPLAPDTLLDPETLEPVEQLAAE
ncbi:cytochrome c [Akkermansiaceae bacterium]|nr:cytochrome c [Akkermansiaceae bacterium]